MRNMLKLSLLVACALVAVSTLAPAALSERAELLSGGEKVASLDNYQVIEDTLFLPVEEACAALDIVAFPDPKTRVLLLRAGNVTVSVDSDAREARGGGKAYPLRFVPIWSPGGVYVPHQIFTIVVADSAGQKIELRHSLVKPGETIASRPLLASDDNRARPGDDDGPILGAGQDPVDIIVIDPGHGGHDSGAKGPGGVAEKDVVLTIAYKLKKHLEREGGIKVYLTRRDDTFVPLAKRPAFAAEKEADLFISVHANGYKYMSARGFETFFASLTATDEAAFDLARFENNEDFDNAPAGPDPFPGSGPNVSGPDDNGPTGSAPDPGDPVLDDLAGILGSMAQTEYLADSERLAAMIQGEMSRVMNSENRGVKQAPFRVLMDSTMPSVLVEVGFITSPAEARTITDPRTQNMIVKAIADATLRYRRETNLRMGIVTP